MAEFDEFNQTTKQHGIEEMRIASMPMEAMRSMGGFQKINVLIAASDIDVSMLLRNALTAVKEFGKVHSAAARMQAIDKLNGEDSIGLVFLSHEFSEEEAQRLVAEAKETKQGWACAYVLIVKSGDDDSLALARRMEDGMDAFLTEPYSVDELVEVARVARRVRQERGLARDAILLKLIVQGMVDCIDVIAFLERNGLRSDRSKARLREMAALVGRMQPRSHSLFSKMLIHRIECAPFPEYFSENGYNGTSKRVRRRMEKKLLASLEPTIQRTLAMVDDRDT